MILIPAGFRSGGVRWTRSGDFMVRWSSAANENNSHLPFRCPRGARPSSRARPLTSLSITKLAAGYVSKAVALFSSRHHSIF